MGRTQEERRAETRAQLLHAAADLFAHKGFHATSAEAVAGAADRTTGALYDHFGGKEGLLVALLELWIEQTVVDLTASIEGEADLDGRLAELWGGIVRRDSASGDAWLLLEFELWLHAARDPLLGEVGAQRFAVMREGLAGGLTRWSLEFGFELPAPADHLATQVIGLLLGLAFQHRLEPAVVPQDSVVDGLRRLLCLTPAGAPAPRRHLA
jgi:AcrR family transcriptional regulator